MIRIDLRCRRKHRRWEKVLIAGVVGGLLVVVGTSGLYWIDQRYPLYGIWRGLWSASHQEIADHSMIVEPQRRQPVAVRQEPDSAQAAAPMVAGLPAPAAVEEALPIVAEQPPLSGRTPKREVEQQRPGMSGDAACMAVLQLPQRLPSSIRLTSLTCKAAGEYSLEGKGASQQEVEDFIETLRRLPSQVDLSWWREGEVENSQRHPFKFIFRGRLDPVYPLNLEAISAAQAVALTGQIAGWARQNGLDRLSLNDPIEAPAPTAGYMQRRQKIWAIGSYAQIGAFLQQLSILGSQVALEEVVIVEVYQEDAHQELARMYAGVDFMVRRP